MSHLSFVGRPWAVLCLVLISFGECSAFVVPRGHLFLRSDQTALRRGSGETRGRISVTARAEQNVERPCFGLNLERRAALGVMPAVLLGTTLAAPPTSAFQVPGSVVQGGGKKEGLEAGTFLQHAVLEVEDLNAEVAFWTKGLGMKVLRKRAGTVFVGYGPETLEAENGGHFSLELTENEDAAAAASGSQRIELLLQYYPSLLVDAEDFGGRIQPRWFGTANFVEVTSPAGYLARISYTNSRGPSPYPVRAVVQKVKDVEKAKRFFSEGLALPKASGFELPFLGDGSATLQLRGQAGGSEAAYGVALILEPLPKEAAAPKSSAGMWKLAAVTERRGELAQQAAAAGAQKLFEGTAPGTATKVTLLDAPEVGGLKVALVDAAGFAAELPTAPSLPPPPPPGPPPKPSSAK